MKRDLFIDNNIACRFSNPMDPAMKDLVSWLFSNNVEKPEHNAFLVVSNKLLNEYFDSCKYAQGNTAITIIIGTLTRQGRLNKFSNREIKDFKQKYFTKTIERKFQSNKKDHDHIPIILMSERKYALTRDKAFAKDICSISGFKPTVAMRPQDIDYKN